MTTIKLVPANIRDVWETIAPELREIKWKWPQSNTWRLEDIYAEVVNGNAILYMTDDGFAICTIEVDRWTGDEDLFIWIASSLAGRNGGLLKKYWPSFIAEAARLGCKGIQTGSLHPALDAWDGMEKLYVTYRYEIT